MASSPKTPSQPSDSPARTLCALVALCALLVAGGSSVSAQVVDMPAAPAGTIEAGVPAFVVIGLDGIGLAAPATELRRLPDGRILVVAQRQLAFGDGVRWTTYSLAPECPGSGIRSVYVEAGGQLYTSFAGAFSRIDFGGDSYWRPVAVSRLSKLAEARATSSGVAFPAPPHCYWHSQSGGILEWRPDHEPRLLGSLNAPEAIVSANGRAYVSDRTDGFLYRIDAARLIPVFPPDQCTPRHAVSSAAPFDSEHTLVGTHGLGLQLFDGRQFTPFTPEALLASESRINDLCALPGGFYAAAIDKVGIAFFDQRGRIVQTLTRALDHRLAGARQIVAGPDALIWVLLDEGVARIEFPSRLSHLEPLLVSGMSIAMPFRHQGDLWLLADGRIQRGRCDQHRRLEHFHDESPGPGFVFAFSFANDQLVAGTADGTYARHDGQWRLLSSALLNARILPAAPREGRWLYCARGEMGRLDLADPARTERIPIPGLNDAYGAAVDGAGRIWIELGTGRVGLVDPQASAPSIKLLGTESGLPDSWAQIFILDGVARFNVGGTIWQFNDATQRFARDEAFLARFAPHAIEGRPGRDSRGHLWIGSGDGVRILDDSGPEVRPLDERLPPGLHPYYFTFERDGVVWLHENRRLVRYDPSMPQPAQATPRALITDVVLSAANHRLFITSGTLPALDYADNSLVAHFMAPANPFRQPVDFEVLLEGSTQDWVSTGNVGSAVFSRLKEGDYRLRVRPRVGTRIGEEARLAFTVRPPWFRSSWAYAIYALALLGTVAGVARVSAFLERREKRRLALLVTKRTHELERQTGALQASEEQYRHLSAELEQRVEQRTAELHRANDQLIHANRELEAFSHSVSHDLRAPLSNISGFADLIILKAANRLDSDSNRYLASIAGEAVRLGRLIESLLEFSRLSRAELQRRTCDLSALVEDVRQESLPALSGRVVDWRIGPLPAAVGDATLLRQVFANLIGNALKYSRDRRPAVIEIGIQSPETDTTGDLVVFIRDNGVGFDPKHADKLFGVFQRLHSAREFEGSGIGLANVQRIIVRHGGHVWARSQPGAGATFFFSLPRATPQAAPDRPVA